MGKIQILSPELVNQIAAGEVVERPASVVKELVENAIDAGATRIEILARDGGRYLRIADNGCGMAREDLEVAFHNHATSKIRSIEDLFAIGTLGFRGEALASVAAIAKVTCMTRTAEASTGLKAVVGHSGQVTMQETGCSPGTIFEVRDLFYNVPARLKFMKRPQTEMSHIQEMVQMLALSHPDITFILHLEDSVAIKTSGSGQLEKAIQEVFSLSEQDTLLPFSLSDPDAGYRVSGCTSTPNITRGSRKWVQVFVNRRGIRCPILGKAVESAYEGMIVPGKFPVTVLFLEVPPEEVDVNVHPTKKEVKYQHANTLFSFVRRALAEALGQTDSRWIGQVLESSPGNAFTSGSPSYKSGFASTPRYADYKKQASPVFSERTPQLDAKPSTVEMSEAALSLYAAPVESELAVPKQTVLSDKPSFRVIGQLAATYILVETPEGLLVVDQHIAGERVLFERFSEQAEKAEPASQHLMVPMTFPVSATQAGRLEELRPEFSALGFDYEMAAPDGEVRFKLVPALYNPKTLQQTLEALIYNLPESDDRLQYATTDIIATAACHSAVRAGDILNHEQMDRIVSQWMACTRPWTCPHGRPVSYLIPHREIMSFFERPSLPRQV